MHQPDALQCMIGLVECTISTDYNLSLYLQTHSQQGDFDIVGGTRSLAEAEVIKVSYILIHFDMQVLMLFLD